MSINRHIDNVMNSNVKSRCIHDERLRSYIVPERIVWKTVSEHAKVENEDARTIKYKVDALRKLSEL